MKIRTMCIIPALALFGLVCSCSFQVSLFNNAPAAPELQSPAADASSIGTLPTLSWSASADPDGHLVTYDLYLDADASPATKIGTFGGTSFTLESSLDNATTYRWKVVATDAYGLSTSSAVRSFTTGDADVTAPSDVADLKAWAGDLDVTFTWTDPVDPDFSYVLISSPDLEVPVKAELGAGQCRVEVPANRKNYTFLVYALDDSGNRSPGVSSGSVKPYKRYRSYSKTNAAGTPQSGYTYEYDGLWRITKYCKYGTSSALPTTYVNERDGEGRIVKRSVFDYLGVLESYVIFGFDADGHSTGSRTYDSNGILTQCIVDNCDSEGKLTSFAVYDAADTLQYSYVYEYDASGNRIGSQYYNASGTLSSYEVYENDSDGNVLKTLAYDGSSGTMQMYTASVYDSAMVLCTLNQYDSTGTLTYCTEYSYD